MLWLRYGKAADNTKKAINTLMEGHVFNSRLFSCRIAWCICKFFITGSLRYLRPHFLPMKSLIDFDQSYRRHHPKQQRRYLQRVTRLHLLCHRRQRILQLFRRFIDGNTQGLVLQLFFSWSCDFIAADQVVDVFTEYCCIFDWCLERLRIWQN